MKKRPQHARKLEAVYDSLTASIRLLATKHPEALDYLAMPMLDLENIVNEANGHPADPLDTLSRPSKTH